MNLWLIQDSTTGMLLDMERPAFTNYEKVRAYQAYPRLCADLSYHIEKIVYTFPRFLIDCVVVAGDGSFQSDMYEVVENIHFDNITFKIYLDKYRKESNAKLILFSKSSQVSSFDKVFIEFVLHCRMSGKV